MENRLVVANGEGEMEGGDWLLKCSMKNPCDRSVLCLDWWWWWLHESD